MSRRSWKGYTASKQFAWVLCALFMIEFVLFCGVVSSRNKMARDQTQLQTDQAIQRATDYLSALLTEEQMALTYMSSKSWVIKLSSNSDVFDDQMTPSSLAEISKDYYFCSSSEGEIVFRGIYFVKHERVMSSFGWNSISYYLQAAGVSADKIPQLSKKIVQSTKPMAVACGKSSILKAEKILLIIPVQSTSKPRAYLFTLLNAENISEEIAQILPRNFTGYEMRVASQDGVDVMISRMSNVNVNEHACRAGIELAMNGWTIDFYIDESVYLQSAALSSWMVMLFLGVLIVSVWLALLLSNYLYNYLERVLVRIPEHTVTNNIMHDLQLSIDSVVDNFFQLQQESHMRALLDGSFNEQDTSAALGFSDDMTVQVLVMRAVDKKEMIKTASFAHIQQQLNTNTFPYYTLVFALNHTAALTIADTDKDAVDRAVERVRSLADESELEIYQGLSAIGRLGISLSYQAALERMQFFSMQQAGTSFYYPVDWEKQLISALSTGNDTAAREILSALLEENLNSLAMGRLNRPEIYQLLIFLSSSIHRVAAEQNITESVLSEIENLSYYMSIEDTAGHLLSCAEKLCREIAQRADKTQGKAFAIVRYINEHFTDPSISSASVQHVFALSTNTLNKQIKEATGLTFLPYLTKLRMEKAKELFVDKSMRLSQVSEAVGYTNEYSFRRAFSRYTGLKVQNYLHDAEKVSDQDEKPEGII